MPTGLDLLCMAKVQWLGKQLPFDSSAWSAVYIDSIDGSVTPLDEHETLTVIQLDYKDNSRPRIAFNINSNWFKTVS